MKKKSKPEKSLEQTKLKQKALDRLYLFQKALYGGDMAQANIDAIKVRCNEK